MLKEIRGLKIKMVWYFVGVKLGLSL